MPAVNINMYVRNLNPQYTHDNGVHKLLLTKDAISAKLPNNDALDGMSKVYYMPDCSVSGGFNPPLDLNNVGNLQPEDTYHLIIYIPKGLLIDSMYVLNTNHEWENVELGQVGGWNVVDSSYDFYATTFSDHPWEGFQVLTSDPDFLEYHYHKTNAYGEGVDQVMALSFNLVQGTF